MTAVTPSPERRRPRPGSIERPVNGRLYRGTWLLVGLPLLLLAFSVARPSSLPAPTVPPAFDRDAAAQLAHDLAFRYPVRAAGTAGAAGAVRWFRQQLAPYGLSVRSDVFSAVVPGRGRVRLVNLIAEKKSALSSREIVVLAHRDDSGSGSGSGLVDNASGTAALIELARSYAPAAGAPRVSLPYSLVFLSTDGAEDGALGAARFAADPAAARNVIAVIDLDSIGGGGPPRLQIAGDTARSPAAGLVETLRTSLLRETGSDPARASGLRQLIDLGFPFSAYEQAPFVTRGIPAVTITTADDRPPGAHAPIHERLNLLHLGQIGRATQNAVDAMEQGVALAQGPSSYVFLGQRLVRGWAIELVLVFSLLPFIAAAVDLFARCRRRRVRVAPALRSYRSRLAFWAWVGAIFALFAAVGLWGQANGRPPSLEAVHWPSGALGALALLAGLGWIAARDRLLPRRPVRPEEVLAGHTAALLALAVVGLLVVATDPFALVFLLPSLHVWLWLPQVHSRGVWARLVVLAIGLIGPGLVVWSFAVRYGLGWDAPWYVVKLFAVGYAPVPLLVIALGWLAAAGQLAAIATGRYAPYPAVGERPPRGPFRELVRRIVLAQRRHRAPADRRRALQG
ncbi:MAG TPA: M28 family peptidase [Gaiellaceae bacterium]|nr:M28 family peptidase [Gaiellaceae bacterium]